MRILFKWIVFLLCLPFGVLEIFSRACVALIYWDAKAFDSNGIFAYLNEKYNES